MRLYRLVIVLVALGAAEPALAACVVDDPTPTPLNIRTAPNGRVIGDIENGRHVTVIDRTMDDQGRPWVYVADEARQPLGWVFRRFIKCD